MPAVALGVINAGVGDDGDAYAAGATAALVALAVFGLVTGLAAIFTDW